MSLGLVAVCTGCAALGERGDLRDKVRAISTGRVGGETAGVRVVAPPVARGVAHVNRPHFKRRGGALVAHGRVYKFHVGRLWRIGPLQLLEDVWYRLEES